MDLIHGTHFARAVGGSLDDFTVLDIGCGGGLASAWEVFGDTLNAIAFDSHVEEIERLSASERRPHVRYVSGLLVGSGNCTPPARNPWGRLAVYRSLQIAERERQAATDKARANDWHLAPRETREIHLPRFLRDEHIASIDFIKIDIDGPDFGVLQSLRDDLAAREVLSVGMEVNWIGGGLPSEHTFCNTDRFMRACGFDLYDFSKRVYSAAALPARYVHPFPSPSLFGRPLQGDAVYVRDLCSPENKDLAASYSPDKLLKLAAIFSMIGQPDSAAEVLVVFRQALEPLFDIDRGLDLLAEQAGYSSYRDAISAFERNDQMFYSS